VVTTPDGRKIKKTDAIMEIEEGRKMESVRKQMEIFIVAWQNFKIAFVEDVLPFFIKILNNTLTPALYAFKKLPNIAKYILVFAVGLASLILPLMIISSGIITLVTVLGSGGLAITAGVLGIIGGLTWFASEIAKATDKNSALYKIGIFFKDLFGNIKDSFSSLDEVKEKWNTSWIKKVFDILIICIESLFDLLINNPITEWLIGKNSKNESYDYNAQAKKNIAGREDIKTGTDYIKAYNQEKVRLENEAATKFLGNYNLYPGKGQQNFSPIPANNTNNTNTNNITLNLSLPNNSDPQSTANVVVDALTNALALNR
jgi:hypothetical protein